VSGAVQSAFTARVTFAQPRGWAFITNHAQVLLAVARRPDFRVREIASATAITERHAYRILRDLEGAGYVERPREGRWNVYRVHPELALGDPVVEEHSTWELLRLIETSVYSAPTVQKHERPFSCGRTKPALGCQNCRGKASTADCGQVGRFSCNRPNSWDKCSAPTTDRGLRGYGSTRWTV
jgi:DNA-binding transcriptional ArsR family regulator